mmetsp:Transcript_17422/g.52620  ORF Transcript_17422/g.52620 Transcript_17422/m.52620 type:complete len:275 (-) Transcript_17422:39-863(-)
MGGPLHLVGLSQRHRQCPSGSPRLRRAAPGRLSRRSGRRGHPRREARRRSCAAHEVRQDSRGGGAGARTRRGRCCVGGALGAGAQGGGGRASGGPGGGGGGGQRLPPAPDAGRHVEGEAGRRRARCSRRSSSSRGAGPRCGSGRSSGRRGCGAQGHRHGQGCEVGGALQASRCAAGACECPPGRPRVLRAASGSLPWERGGSGHIDQQVWRGSCTEDEARSFSCGDRPWAGAPAGGRLHRGATAGIERLAPGPCRAGPSVGCLFTGPPGAAPQI